jgi:hypothetical protein
MMKNLDKSLSVEKLEERFEASSLASMAIKCALIGNTVEAK